MKMHVTRRSCALAAATLILAAPLLGACGFDAATDRINTISSGVNNRDGNIDVLGAVIVASAPNTGLFEATLANNLTSGDGDALISVQAADSDHDVTTAGTVTPIEIAPSASVSMFSTQQGIAVTGTFGAGDFVSVTLGFKSGQSTTMTIPVVRPCYQYAGITSTTAPSASATTLPGNYDTNSTYSSPASNPDGSNNDRYSCTPATRSTAPAPE